jgi:hypothetical protein
MNEYYMQPKRPDYVVLCTAEHVGGIHRRTVCNRADIIYDNLMILIMFFMPLWKNNVKNL